MEMTKKQMEEKELRECEVCGKETMCFSNFCMCDECFGKPSIQKALFRI